MRVALILLLSVLLLVGPLGARVGFSAAEKADDAAVEKADEATTDAAGEATAEGDAKAAPGCGGRAFIGKFGEAPPEGETAVDENGIPIELLPTDDGTLDQTATGGEQGTATGAAAQQAQGTQGAQGAQGAAGSGAPPNLAPGECDRDAAGVIWCNEDGKLKSGCTELPDGQAECP